MIIKNYEEALIFAIKGHDGIKRKYSSDPYIVHPIRVAAMLKKYTDNPNTIIAAILHDLVEDVEWITHEMITEQFGEEVGRYVKDATNVYTAEAYPDLNRATRKELERTRQESIDPEVKKLKLADLIDNVPSIVENNRGFAFKYVPEKLIELEIFKNCGSEVLWNEAYEVLQDSKRKLRLL